MPSDAPDYAAAARRPATDADIVVVVLTLHAEADRRAMAAPCRNRSQGPSAGRATRRRAPETVSRDVGLGSFEGEKKWGDRATALIEDIWFKKIRGCSYREAARPTQRPPCPDNDEISHRNPMA